MHLSDTPIYDQIRQELEAGAGRTDPLTARRSRSDEDSQAVSVWALVNQHRNGKRR
jgi:maltodextrin utilization protein YvdJ